MTAMRSPFRPTLRRTLRRGRMHDPAVYSLPELVRQALFANGEQGWVLDPTIRASMYQDATGTTPVTGVEQPVGLMLDNRFGLARGPELRGEFTTGSIGTPPYPAAYDPATGSATLTRTDNTNQAGITTTNVVQGHFYEVSFTVTSGASVALRSGSVGGAVAISGLTGNVRAVVQAGAAGLSVSHGLSAGTATITGLSVREIPGNHFYQTTTANRPVLRARYNYLHNTVDPAGSAWRNTNSTTTAVGDGFFRVTDDTATGGHTVYQSATGTVPTLLGQQVTCSIVVRAGTSSLGRIAPNTAAPWGGAEPQIRFNLVDGTITSLNSATGTIEEIEPGVFRVTMTTPAVSVASGTIRFALRLENDAGQASYTGDGTRYLDFKEPTLEPGATATRYQWVDASGNYDTEGFPLYLAFDGVDDCLLSNSIDFTGTDKVTVLAGITKLSDAAAQNVVELSTAITANEGAFYLRAPNNADPTFGFSSKGTSQQSSSFGGFQAPTTAVVTGIGDISAPSVVVRVNGVSNNINVFSQGTGTYGNYPAFIGARNNASLRFNGRLYFIAARGALTQGHALEAAEALGFQKIRIAA